MAGRRSSVNGPGGTASLATCRPFTNTSTVEGTTAEPLAVSRGVVISVGCVRKFVPNFTPAKRTAWPQEPASVIASPICNVASRSGMSRDQVVSRRAARPSPPSSFTSAEAVSTPWRLKKPVSRNAPMLRLRSSWVAEKS